MRKLLAIIGLIILGGVQTLPGQNAPITTAGTVTSTTTTATVQVTDQNFTSIGSFGLQLQYDPAIAQATGVTLGPGITGGINTNLTNPGVIIVGWYTYPALTLPGTPVILNITFSKVADGTTALSWYNVGNSCNYSDQFYNTLNDLPTSTYYINGSLTFQGSLNANFTASTTTPAKNVPVTFTDLTTGGPTGWTWSFDRPSVVFVGGTNANSQNPQVEFTDGGLYTVTLVATNSGNTDTEIKVDYIRAGTSGKWCGTTSTDWDITTNWDDCLCPCNVTDVEIPATAPHWPVFTGNLTIGTHCRTINLKGASQLTVTGSLTISPLAALSSSSNSLIRVSGDWTNGGTFNAGAGTVEFIGSGPSSIISAGSPAIVNIFYNLTTSKTGTTLTIPEDVTVEVNNNLVINP